MNVTKKSWSPARLATLVLAGAMLFRPAAAGALCRLCPYCGSDYPSETAPCPDVMSREMPTVVREMPMANLGDRQTLRMAMRRLWTDHAIWLRQYLVAALAGTADARTAADRLAKNADDIGRAMAEYYGRETGDKLAALLKQHVATFADAVAAARGENPAASKAAAKRAAGNDAQIADLLNGANPNWSRAAVVEMMGAHEDLAAKELAARIKKNWDQDTADFDQLLTQALMMSDVLSNGIIKQFPDKFKD